MTNTNTAAATAPTEALSFGIEQHTHSKKGWQYFIATMSHRVEREDFESMLYASRAVGGWYARAWDGKPAGFAFKDEAKAVSFVNAHGSISSHVVSMPAAAGSAPAAVRAPANHGDKLRAIAEQLSPMIADKYRDRMSNTPKRAREAASARNDGKQLENAQRIALALAAAHDAGNVPPKLAHISSRAACIDLGKEEMDTSRSGYYDAGQLTGKPSPWGDTAPLRALAWMLIDIRQDPAAAAAAKLRAEIEGLKFKKIAGYFPTPAAIVQQMIERAQLEEGQDVLEPSAGSGAIADAVKAMGCTVDCNEVNHTLVQILKAKGHDVVQRDCLELEGLSYDAVLMNPPFENGQDVEHVRHCFGLLKAGGVLVSILGAGAGFRTDGKYRGFREWIDELGGELVALPDNSFKESGTGVGTMILELHKPA